MRNTVAKRIKKEVAKSFTGDNKNIYADKRFKAIYRRAKKNYHN